ncbi:hypothetical protein HDC34_001915 [Pseudoclavibacter sp. JAI123]|uniref:hypothetical protein n=1 Tax=Pseudoclavibacter sp. JAI123 TaxID=2723065 RepID=UPI0015C96207|nr:hypothetical protein [Pseudoclavibacter sp. JAI123]NYF13621.1 hypothetical protein [Pseudoclavibacter sp. JAI123]
MNLLTATSESASYDAAGDPVLQWVTIGIAALAIIGTIHTGYRQHKMASELWLRGQRREAYAEFVSVATEMEAILNNMRHNHVSNRPPEHKDKDLQQEYAALMRREKLCVANIELISSENVVNDVKSYSVGRRRLRTLVTEDGFPEFQSKVFFVLKRTKRDMSRELGATKSNFWKELKPRYLKDRFLDYRDKRANRKARNGTSSTREGR